MLTETADIESHVLEYFTNIFTSDTIYNHNDLPDQVIPTIVTGQHNDMLTSIPKTEEIKNVVFSLDGDSAPGPYRYPCHFYHTFWHIMGNDVVKSTQFFFTNNHIMPNLNYNLLILIPKVPQADKLDNFRPIALANFQFKIITKILADRLGSIASLIISEYQRGFIPGRHIQDCIVTASEVVNLLHKKSFGGSIALKIDIRKAFDTLNWDFLLHVLRCFGFNHCFCRWIHTILHSVKLSMSINGKSVGFFSCTRGVRQGDPLSPLLFCLAEEVISKDLHIMMEEGKLSQIQASRGLKVPSHCLYADDILIFCKGTLSNIRNIMKLFSDYGDYSGQIINNGKSKFYTSSLSLSRQAAIASVTGFCYGSLPFVYLGVPLFKGMPKTIYLKPIFNIIKAKLGAWKGIIGRVQLVNSVISSMLVYTFHVYKWPKSLLNELSKLIRNFIWN